MSLVIPDDILEAAQLSSAELRQEIAILLFQQQRLTLGQAARLAESDQLTFQRLLASRRISPHYDSAEFAEDLATIERMKRQ
jgi:predicted HTH domain antitoxin